MRANRRSILLGLLAAPFAGWTARAVLATPLVFETGPIPLVDPEFTTLTFRSVIVAANTLGKAGGWNYSLYDATTGLWQGLPDGILRSPLNENGHIQTIRAERSHKNG